MNMSNYHSLSNKDLDRQYEEKSKIWIDALKKCNYSGACARKEHNQLLLILGVKLNRSLGPEIKDYDYKDYGFWWDLHKSILETWEDWKKQVDNYKILIPNGYNLVWIKNRYSLVKNLI